MTTACEPTTHMGVEFTTWEEHLPSRPGRGIVFPNMSQPRGLPEGWRIRAEIQTSKPDARWGTTIAVVDRETDGWAVVIHVTHPSDGGTSLARTTYLDTVEDSFNRLYAHIRRTADGHIASRRDWAIPVEQMMRDFIARHYDLDNPVEAAEAILVGLGGRPQLMPAVLA